MDERSGRTEPVDDHEARLRRNVEHRVRNTIALIRSVFARTLENAETMEELELHFGGRLEVLARYQLSGVFDRRGDVTLENLVRDELRNFSFGDQTGITIEGPEFTLAADHLQPVALAIHELVTNALKFGALAVEGATLQVTWTVDEAALNLAWTEAGVPIVAAAPQRRGFSRQFIEEALPYQLGAETRYELRPGGVFCSIRVPLGDAERNYPPS